MFLTAAGILLALWLLRSGWKFYTAINWDEAPEPSPDLKGFHKKQAELLHIQEVLAEARAQGKLSEQALSEINRFCESEISNMENIENAWKHRPKLNL